MKYSVAAVLAVLTALLSACSSGLGLFSSDSGTAGADSDAQQPVPTVLILDASSSMLQQDAQQPDGATGSRIDAAKYAADELIDTLPDGTDFSLVTYGTTVGDSDAEHDAGCRDITTLIPLGTLDTDAAHDAVDGITPSGYTPISASLQQAADQLPTGDGDQTIVLISDGEDTCQTPPCDTARATTDTHPGLTISTVGFHTGADANTQLSCIATASGGVFVTADDTGTLTNRLQATQNLERARTALTATGLGGAQISHSADDIRAANPDLPDVAAHGTVTIAWRDCDLTFHDGTLVAIAPHDGGHTIDGISRGSTVGDAIGLYGRPVEKLANPDGSYTLTFRADTASGTGFQTTTDGVDDGSTIDTIVLCRCLPGNGVEDSNKDADAPENTGPDTHGSTSPASSDSDGGDRGIAPPSVGWTKVEVIKPVDSEGLLQPGWTIDTSADFESLMNKSCDYPSKNAVMPGIGQCGDTAASLKACWPVAGSVQEAVCIQGTPKDKKLVRAGATVSHMRAQEDPVPLVMVLENGESCVSRLGGSVSAQQYEPDQRLLYYCRNTDPMKEIWSYDWGNDHQLVNKTSDGWVVKYGPYDAPLKAMKVVKAVYVGTA